MLHILTDEQIDPDVAVAARKRCRGIQITTLFEWLDGHFVGASDEELLREASRQAMTLLSFDLKTIPPLLRAWGERGIDHGSSVDVARLEAALAGFGKPREDVPYRTEKSGVRGGIRSRSSPDRRLIDLDHLVDLVRSDDLFMRAGRQLRIVQHPGKALE